MIHASAIATRKSLRPSGRPAPRRSAPSPVPGRRRCVPAELQPWHPRRPRQVHAAIRSLERETGRPIAILQDLQGPKIRVGRLRTTVSRSLQARPCRFVPGGAKGGRDAIPLPHPEIFKAIIPGRHLLIDDGRVRLSRDAECPRLIEARVVVGGVMSNRKGVNLPGTRWPGRRSLRRIATISPLAWNWARLGRPVLRPKAGRSDGGQRPDR